jgi:hypothetical protein
MEKKTIEEAAEEYLMNIHTKGYGNIVNAFIAGAEWYAKNQSEQMYSEEDVVNIVQKLMYDVHCGGICHGDKLIDFKISPRKWFEQFKKK